MLIAHLSDPHLKLGPLGAEPAGRLRHALGRVLALDPQPDCVVITGDLVQHGDPAEYRVLAELIENFPLPLHLVAGNHDSTAELVRCFGGTRHLNGQDRAHYAVDYPEASVVVLNSAKQDDRFAGRLGAEQLAWLDSTLAASAGKPALVCLHHPPLPVGIPYLDGMRLEDEAPFADVISRHPRVVRVLAGHLHRPVTAAFAATILTVAPSTYQQSELCLRPDRMIGYLDEPTGFLLHRLDGASCVTHTVQVSHAGALIGGF